MDKKICVAARGLCGWNQMYLAEKSGISVATIRDFEQGQKIPRTDTIAALKSAFEREGIEFIDDGLRWRKDLVTVYEDNAGVAAFYEDVYRTVLNGGEIMVYGTDEKKFVEARLKAGLGNLHRERMEKPPNVSVRAIIGASDKNEYGADYAQYRRLPDESILKDAPFYIYGHKVALIIWRSPPKITIINDPDLYETYKKQFNVLWKTAKA